MTQFVNISQALMGASQVRMGMVLRGRELCACQLKELFGLAAFTISRHLPILHQARRVKMCQEGCGVYCSL